MYEEAPAFRPGPHGATRARTRGDPGHVMLSLQVEECTPLANGGYILADDTTPSFPGVGKAWWGCVQVAN